MRKSKRYLLLLLSMVCWLAIGGKAEAATAKKLFSIVVKDGFASQTVPVYLYTETDGTVSVAPKEGLRTIPVYAGAKNASISIKSKSSLYKKTFKSITYKKKVKLSAATNLTFKLKKKDGKTQNAVLKLTRPAMPKISAFTTSANSTAGFTPGNGSRVSVKLNIRSQTAVSSYYKIKNSSGKVVYEKALQSKKNVNYTTYWSGKPSPKNQAGLPTNKYVPAGTYKLTASIEYKVGSKTKTISKTIKLKVNKAQEDTAQNDSAFQGRKWNWTVILSGDDTTDYMAELICQQVLSNNMTEVERAKALYTWIGNNMTHDYAANPMKYSGTAYVDVTSKAAEAAIQAYGRQADSLIAQNKAVENKTINYFKKVGKTTNSWFKNGLIYRKGNCLVMSLIYATLCRHAGIETDLLENTLPSGGGGHHFWNILRVNGVYYMADSDVVTYHAGISNYDYFLRGTDFFYTIKRYNKVRTSGGGNYAIVAKASKPDCPNR